MLDVRTVKFETYIPEAGGNREAAASGLPHVSIQLRAPNVYDRRRLSLAMAEFTVRHPVVAALGASRPTPEQGAQLIAHFGMLDDDVIGPLFVACVGPIEGWPAEWIDPPVTNGRSLWDARKRLIDDTLIGELIREIDRRSKLDPDLIVPLATPPGSGPQASSRASAAPVATDPLSRNGVASDPTP